MNTPAPQHSVDISFAVPFVHRLRFTEDVFGADAETLLELLEPSGEKPPRVQFWLDEDVARAQPELVDRLEEFGRSAGSRILPAGKVQIVPGGETVKNDIHLLERMLKVFNAYDLDRRSYVVVIGGGAVLDAVGFAAAIAHRGIRLIRLPTTTLSQDDSGVGVKNAVNLFQKKNWVGTFAVPWAVINDAALLATLPDRDFVSGFAEAVKVFLLKDREKFDQLCHSAVEIRQRNMQAALPVIRASAELHLQHITRGGDPFEMLEARPLDFGHWSAHKLEVMTNFELRHGEAVGIGVAIDTLYSALVLGLPMADAHRTVKCLEQLGLPLNHPILDQTELLFRGLEEFRQHLGGRLTVTMLHQVGQPVDVHEIDQPRMREAISLLRKLSGRSTAPAGTEIPCNSRNE
ncbi:MAG: 3-dehydroquinate synthase [Planctomycetaceae bacterium]|nr:3-dehydroquinate synthase [Planctomycetaceae bacterium]